MINLFQALGHIGSTILLPPNRVERALPSILVVYITICIRRCLVIGCVYKVSLNGNFMFQFQTHPYFENGAEEFYPMKLTYSHETLIFSLFVNTVSC